MTIPQSGKRVVWTGDNAREMHALLGDRFIGTSNGDAIVCNMDNIILRVHSGWSIARWDDDSGVTVFGPYASTRLRSVSPASVHEVGVNQ